MPCVGGFERIELMEDEFGKKIERNQSSIYRNDDNRNDLTIAKNE